MTEQEEVVVYKTANLKMRHLVESSLVAERISFLERWEKIPLLKRKGYDGAKELCIIFCDRYQEEEAKQIVATVLERAETT